jgi:hypothetical protein
LDFPGANFCGSLPFAWHNFCFLGGKNNQVKNKQLPHKRPVGQKEERIVLKPAQAHAKSFDVS